MDGIEGGGVLTFSKPNVFASAAEMIGGCWTATGAGVADA